MNRKLVSRLLALFLIFTLISGDLAFAASEGGLFSRLKVKAQAKYDQMKTKAWWVTTLAGKATGLVAGKTAGLVGGVLGAAIGLMAGPAGAAVGFYIGYRIARSSGRHSAVPSARSWRKRNSPEKISTGNL